ncbi:sodium-extruding oxaloacetate decarboxylase subunit alpha [Umboniibacter marinipuniceus]|uniref:Oxaloacetate decarboxylase alpha subunit n=1 Tax=Umboniibacter marinipuniceus TaxID=569599 RepID=A0A3M0A9Y7_9GAMM|nr:sodium-extruding oxaloacetate decarboxylase subunit alpha [Umboniibacter marinipuniceus]RMA81357.1 oxaloacetate decarboxylase alpha subunit [Umboniibacter marinipuniceus]
MTTVKKAVGITDVVLRDAHQSLFATRMRIDDMLPIAAELDKVGYWSLESWGGATFDSCIRFLGEDPWDRIRELKKAMPNTPQQMLFRGQNILGYRHYADDVVTKFVERAAINGIDVFRVFDAMNDVRNLETALKAVNQMGKHAQGTLSYTTSPVHNTKTWVDLARRLEDMGANSIVIKDMAGLLRPYEGYELVKALKSAVDIPLQLHAHATTGLSTTTILKCIEAGIDNVDTSISSMSMTYGHSATESVVAMLQGTEWDTGLDIQQLDSIAAYFREVRKKYAKFEGSLRGVDARILVAQVPGGMLTNMESQLKEQGAADKFDEVLTEIPKVRADLGMLPLVTPTSQIVGTQAVLNVIAGERYKVLSKEAQGVLRGEYGATPAAKDAELMKRALNGDEEVTVRPADLLAPELDQLVSDVNTLAKDEGFSLRDGDQGVDDALIYALFPQVGAKFLKHRGDASAFEPAPGLEPAVTDEQGDEVYTVTLNGESYTVAVNDGGDITGISDLNVRHSDSSSAPMKASSGAPLPAPLAGNIVKVLVKPGDQVAAGDLVLVLEAMKMETEVRATSAGQVVAIQVKEGDSVAVGDSLLELA